MVASPLNLSDEDRLRRVAGHHRIDSSRQTQVQRNRTTRYRGRSAQLRDCGDKSRNIRHVPPLHLRQSPQSEACGSYFTSIRVLGVGGSPRHV